MPEFSPSLKSRLLAAGIHLMLSLVIAALAAWLVFALWYPYPYREISGGRTLFLIVVAVDVLMGPLMTFAVFNRSKPGGELRRDLAVIGLLQVAALVYGLWTVSVARPVHLVFEVDRFRVVHAIDIPEDEMGLASAELQRLPWSGPTLLSVREFRDSQEQLTATLGEVQGIYLSSRPSLWQSYDKAKLQVLKVAKSLSDLKNRFPADVEIIDAALKSASSGDKANREVGYVPMAGRDKFWTVLIDLQTTEVIAFVPIDSF